MEQRIAIFGAGGFGREVLQVVRDINAVRPTWSCAGFVVDSGFEGADTVGGLPVLGTIDWLAANPAVQVVVAVGSSAQRWRIAQRIRLQCTNPFAVLIHPRAWIGHNVQVGAGSVICAGALVTTDITIAENVHVNIGCTIGHDARLGDFVTLNPSVNVSGNVDLRAGAQVGTGSIIIPGCAVGQWAIVGAGTVVTADVRENCTVVGAPARLIKERLDGWHKTEDAPPG
jgi:sugar O-acyltransferase (sialic acid O-acetyltransferase NeuD family)